LSFGGVQQQEAEIEELQHTIRILNRKIVVLEDTKMNGGIQDNEAPSTKCNHKPTNETDRLVLAMRDRMTKLVLRRVDEQIKLMEDDSSILHFSFRATVSPPHVFFSLASKCLSYLYFICASPSILVLNVCLSLVDFCVLLFAT
jgi:hypothetical protein